MSEHIEKQLFVNPITGEIMTDEFCGGGGASTGMELATGVPMAVAVNHDPDAILMHQTNHPHTVHHRSGLHWERVREGQAGGPLRKRGLSAYGHSSGSGESAGVVRKKITTMAELEKVVAV